MRAVLIGAGPLTRMTAEILIRRGADVVIIEKDRAVIEALQNELDCAFLHGDGSRPNILKEAGPSEHAILFCLSDNDQANILASLVGRSLGFGRVFTKIEDSEFEHICMELSLDDTIIPDRYVAQILAGIAEGAGSADFSSFLKHGLRPFSFVAGEEEEGSVDELELPDGVELLCVYRSEKALLKGAVSSIRKGDEIVLIVHEEGMQSLQGRWGKRAPADAEGGSLRSKENETRASPDASSAKPSG